MCDMEGPVVGHCDLEQVLDRARWGGYLVSRHLQSSLKFHGWVLENYTKAWMEVFSCQFCDVAEVANIHKMI